MKHSEVRRKAEVGTSNMSYRLEKVPQPPCLYPSSGHLKKSAMMLFRVLVRLPEDSFSAVITGRASQKALMTEIELGLSSTCMPCPCWGREIPARPTPDIRIGRVMPSCQRYS